MINARTILLTLALGGMVAVTGCKNDESKTGTTTGSGAGTTSGSGAPSTTMPSDMDMRTGATTRPSSEPSSSTGGTSGAGTSGNAGGSSGTSGGTEANK